MLTHSFIDSWELRDPDSGEVKSLYFEVLYNYDGFRFPEEDKKWDPGNPPILYLIVSCFFPDKTVYDIVGDLW